MNTIAVPSPPSTVGRPGSSCRHATSGRAPSGCEACASSARMSPASGNPSATTTGATSGVKSATAGIKRGTDEAMPRAIDWQLATVGALRDETPSVRSFTRELADWTGHRPGQHVDLRLTAEDGHSVERSYSIASEPERGREVDISVERIPDGEVSPFLHDVLVTGDM